MLSTKIDFLFWRYFRHTWFITAICEQYVYIKRKVCIYLFYYANYWNIIRYLFLSLSPPPPPPPLSLSLFYLSLLPVESDCMFVKLILKVLDCVRQTSSFLLSFLSLSLLPRTPRPTSRLKLYLIWDWFGGVSLIQWKVFAQTLVVNFKQEFRKWSMWLLWHA